MLAWFEQEGRDLPWRLSRDPFEILVAELMLQQTQVARVLERWPQFLRRFPSAAKCAASPVADVIDEWSGLGYNRRAVFLHRACVTVVNEFDAVMPESLAELLALPGIGPYTARAIRAFAYEADEAIVDTNVGRILARWSGRAFSPRQAQQLADASVPKGNGWAWNQALLDIGATLCGAKSQGCDRCPLLKSCAWQGIGDDPAIGSAAVSRRQSKFSGSDRQGRGRIIDALRTCPIKRANAAVVAGWPGEHDRVERVIEGLLRDGLVELEGDSLQLPGSGRVE